MLKRGRSILVFLFAILAGTLVCWRVAEAGKAGKPQPPPPPTYEYTLTQLKVLPGFTTSSAGAVNDSGQVIGSVTTAAGETHPVVWWDSSKAPTDLDNEFHWTGAYAINNDGVVAGECKVAAAGSAHPVVWVPVPGSPGVYAMKDLMPACEEGWVTGINNHGLVVGSVCWPKGTNDTDWPEGWDYAWMDFVVVPDYTHADNPWFRDDDNDGFNDLMYPLGDMWNETVSACAINDDGWVVGDWIGWAYTYPRQGNFLIIPEYDGDNNPVNWFRDEVNVDGYDPDWTFFDEDNDPVNGDGMNDLRICSSSSDFYSVRQVNSLGQILCYNGVWEVNAVHTDIVQTVARPPGPTSSYNSMSCSGINDAVDIVGGGTILKKGASPHPDPEPMLWQAAHADRGTRLLESLANMAAAGFSDLGGASGINNHGQIVGTGTTSAGQRGYVATHN